VHNSGEMGRSEERRWRSGDARRSTGFLGRSVVIDRSVGPIGRLVDRSVGRSIGGLVDWLVDQSIARQDNIAKRKRERERRVIKQSQPRDRKTLTSGRSAQALFSSFFPSFLTLRNPAASEQERKREIMVIE